MKKPTKKDWKDCAAELYEKLTRFQLMGFLSSHDKSLARFNQLVAKDIPTPLNKDDEYWEMRYK